MDRIPSGVKEGSATDTTIEIINGIGADLVGRGTIQDIKAADTANHLLGSAQSGDQGVFSVADAEDNEIYRSERSEISEAGERIKLLLTLALQVKTR